MTRNRIVIFFSLVTLGLIIFLGLYFLKRKMIKDIGFDKDIFKTIVLSYYNEEFSGVVNKKFIDSLNHNYKKVVLNNNLGVNKEVRFDYEWIQLFNFIKIGDTITKEKKSLDMRLKRSDLDTIIRFNFSNIKNSENYFDFLYELDSVYEK